ncbi:putative oxidoreductase [Streptantibioticus cattleyicolor NRRL 8057 = DSM 46488]|nr:putative oxidoreductase [Streptantibioticus cattleyicolor NRRL 8057 = DSM 46488]
MRSAAAPLKIGVIGLGDIAAKAYLPVLTAQPGVELHLHTRTRAALDRVGDAHRVPHRHDDLDALLAQGLDAAFVHAPTTAHVEIAERLIRAGVAAYVDKPLAPDLAGARHLVELAERHGVPLMTGFNRRYAPAYAALTDRPRDLIVMEKNRPASPEDPRTVVFDDFIHVVDTLRFLAPGAVEHVHVAARTRDRLLHHVVLQLTGAGFSAIGVMNRMSGSAEETLEVMGEGTKRQVSALTRVTDHEAGRLATTDCGDWTPVARRRGIEQITLAFLDAVRTGTPVDARDALRTHELCEHIVTEIERQDAAGAPRPPVAASA